MKENEKKVLDEEVLDEVSGGVNSRRTPYKNDWGIGNSSPVRA